MSEKKTNVRASGHLKGFREEAGAAQQFEFNGRVIRYPHGLIDIQASTAPIFHAPGWERCDGRGWREQPAPGRPKKEGEECEPSPSPVSLPQEGEAQGCKDPEGSRERSERRARSRVRRLALSNKFSYFVTLTLDPQRIDRYDEKVIVRKIGQWLSNQVKRKGLCYILVPEKHKDGAIHFHGFFNNALDVVDSGTLVPTSGGRPRKPRSDAQRTKLLEEGARRVYNIPAWIFGWSTAMELYGDYIRAVGYVCKYIGKGEEMIGGRWYYSGGDLQEPKVELVDIRPEGLVEIFGERAFTLDLPGQRLVIVNGIKEDKEND